MAKSLKTYHFHKSLEVPIGDLVIGGDQPITVQSMTNTNTLDTAATVKQVIDLANAGCDIVRITAPSIKEAENLANIKAETRKKGCHIPLVADIHFTPKPAEIAARIVKKVRINPGNYVDRNRGKVDWTEREIIEARERIAERLIPLLMICKENGTAIRIGTNHGSLSERILAMYGNTPEGMVESAMEFVRICNDFGFHKLVLSMKASSVKEMTAANLLLVEEMIKEGFYYPIHLGVTEAGNGEEARIKSAAGIGSLLAMGIGDTVRVSLAEDPVKEVPVAQKLVQFYGRNNTAVENILKTTKLIIPQREKTLLELSGVKHPVVTGSHLAQTDLVISGNDESMLSGVDGQFFRFSVSDPSPQEMPLPDRIILKRVYDNLENEDLLIKSATDFSVLFKNHKQAGIWIENGAATDSNQLAKLSMKILQGLGLRYSKAEFVACPSCGRTKFNLFDSFNKVKQKTSHLKGLQIAVMGCIVNGPGEMGDADYGYVGAGPGKVTLYRNGNAVIKNVDQENAVDELITLIRENGDWTDPEEPTL